MGNSEKGANAAAHLAGRQARDDADALEGVPGHTSKRLHLSIVLPHKIPAIAHLPG